jgi:purine-binding chemotaxis protein CheW
MSAQLPAAGNGSTQYLSFALGSRVFALGISGIKEIIKFGQVTRVPRSPAHIRGVINLRGAVLPVLDLNVYVGQPSAAADGQTCIVVIEAEGSRGTQPIGLMVDSVSAVLTIADASIEPPPSFGAGLPAGVLLGMAPVRSGGQDGFIAVLDASRAFSLQALAQRGWLPATAMRPLAVAA